MKWQKGIQLKLVFVLCIMILITGAKAALADAPAGWGIVNALGVAGITGGGNGEVVVVDTRTQLRYHAGRKEPVTIYIDGLVVGSGNVKVESNKTIIGLGDDAILARFGFDIIGKENIIIRNLTIRDVQDSDDAISINNSHHIWIDHCHLSRAKDGLLDITKGSDYITVSATIFFDHDKCSLLNSGTNEFVDYGKCRVTYYGNWYDKTVQRNPRVGYGLAHVFNNYYTDIESYAIGTHTQAKVLAENNYFLNSRNPIHQMYSGNPEDANYGDIESRGNIYLASTGSTEGTGISFNPEDYYDYSFILLAAEDVPEAAQAQAGPGKDFVHLFIPVPGNGLIDYAASQVDLSWVDTKGADSWSLYFGQDEEPNFIVDTTAPQFTLEGLEPATTYYWRVDAHRDGQVETGSLWRFRTAGLGATKPFPEHAATIMPYYPADALTVKPMELTWVGGFENLAYDVYLGTNPTLTAADYQGQVAQPVFAPGRLPLGETYYWRVDSVTAAQEIIPGETYSFTLPIAYLEPGRMEAEDMVFGGLYFREIQTGGTISNGALAKIESGPGSLSAVWSGEDASCQVQVAYQDQNGGQGRLALFVNDDLIDSWVASANSNKIEVRQIDNVQLRTGDELRVEASTHLEMLTRIDYLDVVIH